MYTLDYLPAAIIGILEAETYLNEHSPRAAEKFAEAVERQTDLLLEHPFMCSVSIHDETLRLMVLPYQYHLFYRVDE